MEFEYQIKESDYLDFQLYTVSKSPRFFKKQNNGRYFLAICSLITASYFLYSKNMGMLAYFGLTTVVFLLFYPKYYKWRQKVHYIKFIRRNYRNLFDKSEVMEVKGKQILLKNYTGEGTINSADLDKISETKNHFFIQLKSGASLIIPKTELTDTSIFKKEIKKLGLPYEVDLEWVW